MAVAPGRFVWLELMSTDVERVRTYYSELFNWKLNAMDMPGGTSYSMFMAGEKGVGGSMTLPDEAKKMGAPSHWLVYGSVDDVDASAAKVTELGGKILMPAMSVPGVGRFSTCMDPQGGVFALFRGEEPEPDPEGPPAPGEWCWHELATPDPEAALTFYSTIFGWSPGDTMDMGEGGTYHMANRNDKAVAGIMQLPPPAAAAGAPASWLSYTVVEGDLAPAMERATSLGGTLLHGPMDVPGGAVAVYKDPTGAAFGIFAGTPSN